MSQSDQPTVDLPAHLTKQRHEVPGSTQVAPSQLTSRECWCMECGLRVTQSVDKAVEYGHKRECRHKVERSNHLSGGQS